MMINVVEAISDTNIGGAGVLLLNRLKRMDKNAFNVTVILPEGSALEQKLKDIGIRTVAVDGGMDSSFGLSCLIKFVRTIKEINPDILNSHASLNSRIAGTLVGVPVRVYTRHCVYPTSVIYKNIFVRYTVGKITDFLSDAIIAVAYSARRNLVQMGINKSKIKVIINGAEPLRILSKSEREALRQRLGISADKTVVTICARLEPCKNHECFLKAARLLCVHSDEYRFLIIGGGSLESYLRNLCFKLGVNEKVIFTGFVDDVAPFMNITDINVNCSIGTETSSLALSEGMSLAVPCVASDYGGNPYMVKNGKNGYIYKAGDYRDLAEKIKLVRSNYKRLAKGSKQRFTDELNASAMTKKTEALYLALYNKKMRNF